MGKHFDVSGTSTRFGSAADFKFAMDSGCETEFIWRGVRYGAIRYGTGGKITIYAVLHPETESVYDTADDALDHMLGEDRLGDVITRVEVLYRTI